MADSPLRDSEGVLKVQVHSDGKVLPDEAQIISVQVRRAFGHIASARLVLVDGEMSTGEWALADADVLKPGALVSIAAGYGERASPIFEGVVAIAAQADASLKGLNVTAKRRWRWPPKAAPLPSSRRRGRPPSRARW